MREKEYDVAVIGGGFRSVTFLASSPRLAAHDIAVIEPEETLGSGAFAHYDVVSASAGRAFFRQVSESGQFSSFLMDDRVVGITAADSPVPLQSLGGVLCELGDTICRKFPSLHRIRDRVMSVDVEPGNRTRVTVNLASGGTLSTKVCILATGREEVLRPELLRWQGKVEVSGYCLSRKFTQTLSTFLRDVEGSNVSIIGGSHSAFAVAKKLAEAVNVLQLAAWYVPPTITVYHRSDVRVQYKNVKEALSDELIAVDRTLMKDHVCPETGIVFRDTGLRHSARDFYRAIRTGKVPFVRLSRFNSFDTIEADLDRTKVIVQATGYQPRVPEIRFAGAIVRSANNGQPLTFASDGCVQQPEGFTKALIALRVDPTPRAQADSGLYAKDLYSNAEGLTLKLIRDQSCAHAVR